MFHPRSLLLSAAVLLTACFDLMSGRTAGGTSETSNGDLVAAVTYSDGKPAARVRVLVVDESDWLVDVVKGRSVVIDSQWTDAEGKVRVDLEDCRSCNLQIDAETEGLFVRDVQTLATASQGATRNLKLAAYGAVSGALGTDPLAGIGILGATYRAVLADGSYRFDAVPPGEYVLVQLLYGELKPDGLERKAVVVEADSAVAGPVFGGSDSLKSYGFGVFAGWPRYRMVAPEVPADLQDTLVTFPMRIRIDASNFDFRQSNGKDVRFSDWRGNEVPHDFNHWDSIGRRAEIWVKARHEKGRNDSLAFLWGKQGVHNTANAVSVFSEFSAFWYLTRMSPYFGHTTDRDASPGNNPVKGTVTPPADSADGLSGNFGPGDSLIAPAHASLKPDTALTLTAWVRADRPSEDMYLLGYTGAYRLGLLADGGLSFSLRHDTLVGMLDNGWVTLRTAGTGIAGSGWRHVTVVYDGAEIRLYIDGALDAKVAHARSILYPVAGEFRIGGKDPGCDCAAFLGRVKEVGIAHTVFSPDRIRLGYLNQR